MEPVAKKARIVAQSVVDAAANDKDSTAAASHLATDETEEEFKLVNRVGTSKKSQECPYLGTINRNLLDFDFEKVCSISLSNQHVYCCLVCGRYLQGRGPKTHAFTHALQENHFIFMDLQSGRVFCLPDNYEIDDASLSDIKFNLRPTFTREEVASLDTQIIHARALDGSDFTPGLVGLNVINSCTDYANVIIQLLCVIIPVRNFFLLLDVRGRQRPDPVVVATSDLVKKIFNPRNFKGIVCPHEFLQAISSASKKKYSLMEQSNAFSFLTWLLNHLHLKLRRNRKDPQVHSMPSRLQPSIILDTLSGEIQTWSSETKQSSISPFFSLTLDVPPAPIFKSSEDMLIPEVHIFDLLDKFGGQLVQGPKPGTHRRLSIWKLPKFLIVHLKRFSKNSFFLEKNPTIVKFPAKDLDLADYIASENLDNNPCTRYDLIGNILHVGNPIGGTYKAEIRHEPTDEWFDLEDLRVTSVLAQQVAISASFIQLYRRQDVAPERC